MRRRIAAAALLLALLAAPAAAKEVPFLSGRVVDEAELLPAEVEARLDSQLAALEREKGAQVAVLTVESLEGDPLEDFSIRVVETWKLGREGVDDGVLLLVAEQDRQMRIEVGYGLEGALTDLESRRILDEVMRPAFRRGDFAGGIEGGVAAIAASVRGEPLPEPETDMAEGLEGAPWFARVFIGFVFLIVVGTFSLSALASDGCGAWGLYLFLMPFYFAFPTGVFDTPIAGLVAWLGWTIGFPLLRRLGATPRGRRFWTDSMGPTGTPGRWFAPGGFGGGRGGGWTFGGGGGFSGGGGSFGGGGASSGW